MLIISDLDNFQPPWNQAVICLGDFDGIHLGHRKLIQKVIRKSSNLLKPVLVTYDPSPKKVLSRLKTDSNIYTREEKIIILQSFNLFAAIFVPFNIEMSRFSAKYFLKNILIDKLKASHIILGYDHQFGRNRHGNYKYVKMAEKKYHHTTEQIKSFRYGGAPISSTRIRILLKKGEIKKANKQLGSPFLIMGTVIRGRQRGRKFGIPTANLHIPPEKLIPREGVYFCIAQYGSHTYKAVVNIGFNPTFANVDLSIEAHLLNFHFTIYGETLKLFFHDKIRDEIKFESIDSLKKQILKDIAYAKSKTVKL